MITKKPRMLIRKFTKKIKYEQRVIYLDKKNILVTGADGFIGKRLVEKLEKIGCKVFTHTKKDGDIADCEFGYDSIDHVIHLAALTFVPASWENSKEFYRVNVMGTQNILEFCRKSGSSLTFFSTYVYGKPKSLPVKENHPVDPNTPYNHSKVMSESLCDFYNKAFNIDITVLRPFNIYGKGQSDNFLVPAIIRQVVDNSIDTISVMDLTPKRDYIYIDDLIEAVIATINQKGYNIYNLGSGYSLSVKEVIDIIQRIAKTDKPYISKNYQRKGEVNDVIADISKITSQTNWKPMYTFENGIEIMLKDMVYRNT